MKRLILILPLIVLACYIQSVPATITPAATATQIYTPEIVVRPDMLSPIPTPAIRTFTVTASTLYIRNQDEEVSGYLHRNDLVICMPTESGWCLMERGRMVWSGCLEPNPNELGCEAK